MKLFPIILIIQFVGLARAQSSCEKDLDTFEDGTGRNGEVGKGCSFYQGKDCWAVSKSRGLNYNQRRILLQSCRNACGFCGKDTIVKQCTDTSCECKDTNNFQMKTPLGQTLTCNQHSIGACIFHATQYLSSDKQIREYMTNCAASCEICSPCSNVGGVGDGICDPGNNNDKCYKIERDGSKSAGYDSGDCCNQDAEPFFDEGSANSLRYLSCAKMTSSTDKQLCKCLDPNAPNSRTKDCAGGFGDFGECSVTCGAYGVRKRTFVVLHPAQAGGRPCEFKDGEIQQERCGRPSKKCPSTTTASTTTTTTKSTTTSKSTTTTSTTTTTNTTTNSSKPGDSDDDAEVDEVDLTTVSTMMATVICLIYSLV